MGHLFQVKCWEKYPSWCSFQLLWLSKLENPNEKYLERENGIFGIFIYENNGNYEKMEMKGHRLHVRTKMK